MITKKQLKEFALEFARLLVMKIDALFAGRHFILVLLLSSFTVKAQTDEILKLNGEKIKVEIKKVNETSIDFLYPGETVMQSIYKNSVEFIRYASGREEKVTDKIVVLSEDDYPKVIVTNSDSDIKGLTRVGEIMGKHAILYGGQAKIRKTAIEKLKREAAKQGAHIVLIQSDQFSMTPINNVLVQGVAYKY
jgi:hypothetical protein